MNETDSKTSSIIQISDKLVRLVQDLIKNVKSEEELRIGFEKILSPLQKELGIEVIPKYDRTVYKSRRPDAVHGQVIIEYEALGAFQSEKWINHALAQLIDYIEVETQASKNTLFLFEPKFQGIGFDGKQIFFTRYIGDKTKAKNTFNPNDFKIDGPYQLNKESATTFLTYMRALSRLPLTADNLTDAFGPNSKTATQAVKAFANSLEYWSDQSPRVRTFFNEWKRLFGIVYGESLLKNGESEPLTKIYPVGPDTDFQELLFSIHTYFALLIKLIAIELLTFRETDFSSSFSSKMYHSDDGDLEKKLTEIENGGIYSKKGITNFLEGDFFRWYLDALSPELKDSIREITKDLSEFEPATTIIDPESTRDLLKKLYQNLVPKEVRHQLGEYYTPDWLAELLIEEVGYDGNNFKRVLDPACGSGTFLVLAIQRAKEWGLRNNRPLLEIAKGVKNNIWGFDLNPLAVIAARTNYLFALGDLVNDILSKGGNIEIPIYLADSVLWPQRDGQMLISFAPGDHIDVQTSVGIFHVPKVWVNQKGFLMKTATPLLEEMVKEGYEPSEAVTRLTQQGLVLPTHKEIIVAFYKEILELEKQNKNGIWARFLKNAFAPMVAGKFDYVIGNPPWIRWGYLSEEYRQATLPLWKNYGLFSLKGHAARLGGGEKDFSMLFTYAASDYYLTMGGKLGFLITQEVFKSKGAGEGFRRFQLGEQPQSLFIKVIKTLDLATVQPFEGASNKTAAIILSKGEKTTYPVPYFVYSRKKGVGKISQDILLKDAKPLLTKKHLLARPLGDSDVSSWQTYSSGQSRLDAIKGSNFYLARQGIDPQPYGVYIVKIKQVLADDKLLSENLPEKGKGSQIKKVEAVLESSLVYPGLSGADIQRWGAKSSFYTLMVQDPSRKEPIPETAMKERYPRTYSYLLQFKETLLSRASKSIKELAQRTAFYAMFGVGEYTMFPYKVVWKLMSNDIFAAVISQQKTLFGFKQIMPIKTVAMFCVSEEPEAHYLCSIVNSKVIREFIKTYSSSGRGFGTPSVMKYLGIPKFDSKNPAHVNLSDLSKKLHELKSSGKENEIPNYEKKVDEAVTKFFRISKEFVEKS